MRVDEKRLLDRPFVATLLEGVTYGFAKPTKPCSSLSEQLPISRAIRNRCE